ncbi:FimB/Mfa2 family fimbrial subunit [Dysgonomonas sp. Marseille-P4677]|uniref:FimB/Mfa2 family fimbrial subunit n=1 Tax=Dysgonomonas sp. Marseille-P4677 TaxID=2364790 RepID=UPI0019146BBC|nr:FimB/Mfa2 family fimbrial subunit [Dysgonomonas sp. Marseille-P4677]MBK5722596.1 FimB/Mfa2 family fimbrial subunit [Dysgonomonas sp. Marseille-P4677]
MRMFHIALLLFSVILLHSCIGEDLSSCRHIADNNLIIEFLYTDNEGQDIFCDRINKVNLFVFDENGCFVTSHCEETEALSVFAGTKLSLPPGTYRIIFWGNAADKCEFRDLSIGCFFSEASLCNISSDTEYYPTNGDPLYYAPAMISEPLRSQQFIATIPIEGTTSASVSFGRAHIKIAIYIKGFEDKSDEGTSLTPVIELTDIPPSYNFELQAFGDPVCYGEIAEPATIDGEQLSIAEFNTPVFREDTPMQLIIKKQSDGGTLTTINLKDFIRKNNIDLQGSSDLRIPIFLEYKQGSFEITLPDWGQNPIGPET